LDGRENTNFFSRKKKGKKGRPPGWGPWTRIFIEREISIQKAGGGMGAVRDKERKESAKRKTFQKRNLLPLLETGAKRKVLEKRGGKDSGESQGTEKREETPPCGRKKKTLFFAYSYKREGVRLNRGNKRRGVEGLSKRPGGIEKKTPPDYYPKDKEKKDIQTLVTEIGKKY